MITEENEIKYTELVIDDVIMRICPSEEERQKKEQYLDLRGALRKYVLMQIIL